MSEAISEREKRVRLMENGEVKKTLITLGIPSIIAMIITAIYNFVDTLFIGMLNDTVAMSAVSIAFPILMILSSIGQLVGVGASSYTSRMLGNKRHDLANKAASISIVLSITFTIITMTLGLIFLDSILRLVGASENVLPVAGKYVRWIIIGSIFTITNMNLNNLIRAEGNAKYSMQALILGAVINIILDPIFMFVLKGGISGAALATVVGQCCSTIYLLKYYISKKSFVKMDLKLVSKNIRQDKEIYKEIFKIGTPLFVMQFLYSVAFSLLNNSAMPYGDAAVAAMGISMRIYMIPLYIIMGFIQGFQPFAAYNFGAKLYGRLDQAIKFSAKNLIIIGFVFMIVIQLMPQVFVGMFTKDPTVTAYAINALTSVSLLLPIIPILFLVTSLFQALGKAKQSAVLSLSRQGIILIPLASTLPKLFETMGDKLSFLTNLMRFEMPNGLYGVILAQPISDGLTVLLALILGISVIKELKQLENQNEEEYDTSKKYAYNR